MVFFSASLLDFLIVNLPGGVLIISVSVGNSTENGAMAASFEQLSAVLILANNRHYFFFIVFLTCSTKSRLAFLSSVLVLEIPTSLRSWTTSAAIWPSAFNKELNSYFLATATVPWGISSLSFMARASFFSNS